MAKNCGCDVQVSLAEALLRGVASIFYKFMVNNWTAYKPMFVDTRGGTHRKDSKRTVVRVGFHQGVILGIESTGNKE